MKALDLNQDGKENLRTYFDDKRNITKEEIDGDFDGVVDIIDYYTNNTRTESQIDTNTDRILDVFRFYDQGHLVREAIDFNYDQTIDTTYIYDADGNKKRENSQDVVDDHHLRNPVTFSHKLDPDFIQPATFQKLSGEMRYLSVLADRTDSYARRTVEYDPNLVTEESGPTGDTVTTRLGHQADVAKVDGKRTVQANNCETKVIDLLQEIKSANGQYVIDMTDFQLLGLENEKYVEGLDILPQDFFEHLRWKEKHFLATRKATDQGVPQ